MVTVTLQHRNPCLVGCTLEDMLHSLAIDSELPRNPLGPPSLNQGDGGQYIVDLSVSAQDFVPEQVSNRTEFPEVVFLFRIEEVNTHNFTFIWMVRLKYQCTINSYC